MKSRKLFMRSTFCLAVVLGAGQIALAAAPDLHVDSSWPGPLPNKWAIGQVSGMAVTAQDHILVIHRPKSVKATSEIVAAPPVVEFTANGKMVRAWGGPGNGYDWPQQEHGIYVDGKGNIWISGVAGKDFGRILKFSSDGKFLMQIGANLPAGEKFSNSNTSVLGKQPADMHLDLKTNELFVADGDGGASRVVVIDAETGKFKRMWGAYGEKPGELPAPKHDPNDPPSKLFAGSIHCIVGTKTGLLYVCDRDGNRIQVFKEDGTFVKEKSAAPKALGSAVFDVEFSHDGRYLYWVDGKNQIVRILQADSLEEVGSFGGVGAGAGQFRGAHSIAVDSKNNVYTGEAGEGARVQKFVLNAH